jgi:hypothetical protein
MRIASLLTSSLILAGCASGRSHPPTGCDQDGAGCAGQSLPVAIGGGGGGGGDAGVTDAALGDAVAMVSGRLLLAATLPRPTTTTSATAAAAWTVGPVVSPAGTTLSTTTAADGTFTLAGVPVVGSTYVLHAEPPAGGGLHGAVAEFYAGSPSSTFFAISDVALSASLSATGITPSPSLAHLVVEAVDGGARASGIRVAVDATASIAYDDASGALTTGADRTGALGTAVVLNVDAPAGGRYASVQLTRVAAVADASVVVYGVFVMPGHVSFVSAAAPP